MTAIRAPASNWPVREPRVQTPGHRPWQVINDSGEASANDGRGGYQLISRAQKKAAGKSPPLD